MLHPLQDKLSTIDGRYQKSVVKNIEILLSVLLVSRMLVLSGDFHGIAVPLYFRVYKHKGGMVIVVYILACCKGYGNRLASCGRCGGRGGSSGV